MTEQQQYEVVAAHDGFELRRYAAHTVAEVEVSGGFESAGNRAFQPLVGYIGGRNAGGRSVAMTAPVVQQPARADVHRVAFVMPAGESVATLPPPADPRVRMREVPEELAAVVRYSGRWTERGYDEHVLALADKVRAAGFEVAGPPRWARFDPPWTPWFLRRNEVVLPVREPTSG